MAGTEKETQPGQRVRLDLPKTWNTSGPYDPTCLNSKLYTHTMEDDGAQLRTAWSFLGYEMVDGEVVGSAT